MQTNLHGFYVNVGLPSKAMHYKKENQYRFNKKAKPLFSKKLSSAKKTKRKLLHQIQLSARSRMSKRGNDTMLLCYSVQIIVD